MVLPYSFYSMHFEIEFLQNKQKPKRRSVGLITKFTGTAGVLLCTTDHTVPALVSALQSVYH